MNAINLTWIEDIIFNYYIIWKSQYYFYTSITAILVYKYHIWAFSEYYLACTGRSNTAWNILPIPEPPTYKVFAATKPPSSTRPSKTRIPEKPAIINIFIYVSRSYIRLWIMIHKVKIFISYNYIMDCFTHPKRGAVYPNCLFFSYRPPTFFWLFFQFS